MRRSLEGSGAPKGLVRDALSVIQVGTVPWREIARRALASDCAAVPRAPKRGPEAYGFYTNVRGRTRALRSFAPVQAPQRDRADR